ncbi:TetR/AcrR family transcriptional regulator [Aquincola sp. S2]|uniref:TetR/AcrR family transcriptional regulator n=1 Tax=Pseudaquabacterium terrae TaxID=2732868 RepID=A0ABX2EUL8_9BURK|nr:helix-turn-helix domain-containing protein [Aquabacterium terrae]NRF72348.1 TetR/AcrR family transcriptional regulator [Aquabacterium terrae]
MPLDLPPHFLIADFKRVAPVDASTVWDKLLERNAHRLTVKRPAALENLRTIVETTFRLANKVGFGAMTLRDLSGACGLSMGGLYGYIASKDDLAAMIEDMIRFLAAEIPGWFDGPWPALERLEAMLRGHVYITEILQPWFYFVFLESRTLSEGQRQVAKASEMDVQQGLTRLFAEAGIDDALEAQVLAGHFLALSQDWYVKRWKYRQLKVPVDAFADSICRLARARVEAGAAS